MPLICVTCKEEKATNDMRVSNGKVRDQCKGCHNAYNRERAEAKRAKGLQMVTAKPSGERWGKHSVSIREGGRSIKVIAACMQCKDTSPESGFAPVGEDDYGNLLMLCYDCWYAYPAAS